LHHRCLAGEPKMILDFACAGRNPLLALLALNKIKNASLPLRQHVGMIAQHGQRASSNEQVHGYRAGDGDKNYIGTSSTEEWYQKQIIPRQRHSERK